MGCHNWGNSETIQISATELMACQDWCILMCCLLCITTDKALTLDLISPNPLWRKYRNSVVRIDSSINSEPNLRLPANFSKLSCPLLFKSWKEKIAFCRCWSQQYGISMFTKKNVSPSLQFRERRIAQEKELLTKQNEWSNSELKSKTEELAKLRKEKVLHGSNILYTYCTHTL